MKGYAERECVKNHLSSNKQNASVRVGHIHIVLAQLYIEPCNNVTALCFLSFFTLSV